MQMKKFSIIFMIKTFSQGLFHVVYFVKHIKKVKKLEWEFRSWLVKTDEGEKACIVKNVEMS